LPAPQSTQVEAAVAPTAAENLPATQLLHSVEAVAAEYLPAIHAVQLPGLPKYPARQLHSLIDNRPV